MLGFPEDSRYRHFDQESGLFEGFLILLRQLLVKKLIEPRLNGALLLLIELIGEGLFGGVRGRDLLPELGLNLARQAL